MFPFFSRPARSHRRTSARTSPRSRHQRLSLEALDSRLLLSGTPLETVNASAVMADPVIALTPRQIDQQMGLPLLDSRPGAAATLYLDFDGNVLGSWSTGGRTFTNVSTPVWDMDGDTTSFSSAEQALIREVWSRVAEDYAPFDINVSTDYYGSFADGQALQVCIGGNNTDWLHLDASGISSIGSFHDSEPNVVFAFDMVAWARAGVLDGEGRPMNGAGALADTISHEAGHSFGLFHHSTYDGAGHLVAEYDPGSSNWTPIMGNNRSDDRTTWAFLPTDLGATTWQDDMAVIGGTSNGFGFRADDHGDSTATADALVRSGIAPSITSPLTGRGVINQPTDRDFFSFIAPGGSVRIEVDAATYGPNLLPVLQLWNRSGLVTTAGSVTPTRSIITADLPAGTTYYIRVSSFGDYGDVGQYTVSVSQCLQSLSPTSTVPTMNATTYLASSSTTTTAAPKSSFVSSPCSARKGTVAATTPRTVLSPATPVVQHVPTPVVKLVAREHRGVPGTTAVASCGGGLVSRSARRSAN